MGNIDYSWEKYCSKFKLKFRSEKLEKSYMKFLYNPKPYLIFSVLILLCTIANTVLFNKICFPKETSHTLQTNSTNMNISDQATKPTITTPFFNIVYCYINLIFSFLVTITFFFTLVYDLHKKYFLILRVASLMMNFSIRLFFYVLAAWFPLVFAVDNGNVLILASLRSAFVFLYVLIFDYTFFLNATAHLAMSVLSIVFNSVYFSVLQTVVLLLIDTIFAVCFFYFIEKFKRDSFFAAKSAINLNKNLENVFDSLQIGVAKFDKNFQPTFLNKFMYNKFIQLNDEFRKNETVNELIQNSSKNVLIVPKLIQNFKNFIFSDINSQDALEENKFSKIKEILQQNKKIFDDCLLRIIQLNQEYFKEFQFLGTKTLYMNNEESYIEVYIRYDIVGEMVEILYSDATRTKKIEEMRAEIKFKTLFLSKVAHEFKNPLLCVSELINGIENPKETNSTLLNISHLCDYMLILVQDFDFLSMKELKKKLDFNVVMTKIEDIIQFSVNIFKTRVKLNKKNIDINFIIEAGVPDYIETDEIRLKQILINLLSNSYKFTDSGAINIYAQSINNAENAYIKFSVSDTGCGIPKEKLVLLNNDFCKLEQRNNQFGAGLGLGIVKDMVTYLGEGFEINSIYGEGTTISFLHRVKQASQISHNLQEHFPESLNENWIVNQRNLLSREMFYSKMNNTFVTKEYKLEKIRIKKLSETLNNSIKTKVINVNSLYLDENDKDALIDVRDKNDFIKNFPHSQDSFQLGLSQKSEKNVSVLFSLKEYKKAFRILIVEDEELIKKSVVRNINNYFQKIGEECEVDSCSDGAECLNILYKAKFDKIYYDAVITDESMNFISGGLLVYILNYLIEKTCLHPIKIFVASSNENVDIPIKTVNEIFKKPLGLMDIKKIHSKLNKKLELE